MNSVGGILQNFLVCILTAIERELVSKIINCQTLLHSAELHKFS